MLRSLAEQFMNKLRNTLELVRTYFEHTHTRYASGIVGLFQCFVGRLDAVYCKDTPSNIKILARLYFHSL